MPDEPVAEQGPLVVGNELHQISLDFFGCFGAAEPKALAEPGNVGVNHDPVIDAEGIPEDHVGGLATDSREGREILHGPGHVPVKMCHQSLAAGLDVSRLASKQTNPADRLLQLVNRCLRKIGCRLVSLE